MELHYLLISVGVYTILGLSSFCLLDLRGRWCISTLLLCIYFIYIDRTHDSNIYHSHNTTWRYESDALLKNINLN